MNYIVGLAGPTSTYFESVVIPMFEKYGRQTVKHADFTLDANKKIGTLTNEVIDIIRTRTEVR